jgi:hypothetical protein
MKVVDIANEIYLENASPSDTTIPAIAFWIRSNVGKLNAMLYERFFIDSTTLDIHRCCGEQVFEIGQMGSSIIKLMFKVYRADLDIRNMLYSATTDTILKATDQEFSVEKVNKSELLKTLSQLKKDTLKELQDLVHNYRSFHGEPSQVAGDDTVMGHYTGITSQYTRNVIGGGGEYNGTLYDQYEAT